MGPCTLVSPIHRPLKIRVAVPLGHNESRLDVFAVGVGSSCVCSRLAFGSGQNARSSVRRQCWDLRNLQGDLVLPIAVQAWWSQSHTRRKIFAPISNQSQITIHQNSSNATILVENPIALIVIVAIIMMKKDNRCSRILCQIWHSWLSYCRGYFMVHCRFHWNDLGRRHSCETDFMNSWGDLILVSTLIIGRSLNIAAQFRVFIIASFSNLSCFYLHPPLYLGAWFNIVIIYHKIIQNRQFAIKTFLYS